MSSYQELATFVATKTAVLPGLFAFSLGARQSLKTYLAVKAVPDAPPVEEKDLKRMKRVRAFAGFATVAAILGTEFYLLGSGDEQTFGMFCRVVFGFVYQMAFMGTLIDLTKAFSWSVFRSPGRMLHYRPAKGTVSFPRVFASFAIATALNVAAYFEYHAALGSVLTVALLHRTISQGHRRTFSIRIMSLAMLVWLGLTFVLSGALVFYLVNHYKETPDGALVDEEGNVVVPAHPDEVTFMSTRVKAYVDLISPFIYSVVPGMLIAGCYRFDYENAVEEDPSLASAVTLETVEPRSRFARVLSGGIIVPSKIPTRFYKPYFATAFRCWFLAQLVVVGLFAGAVPLDADVLKTACFELLGLTTSIPLMIVGLAITASVRGEFRKLWRRKEVWTPKEGEEAEGGVVLADEEANEEETLPSYPVDEKAPLLHDEAVAAESAPAYEVEEPLESKA
ncbi:hypothetical protein JCM8097_007357 [Rhodosporidiobolus ruineniae]